jgi:adenylate kinase family enzyme
MQKILIFGNSGSGKSTLAKQLSDKYSLEHLDLDVLAWSNSVQPIRKPITESKKNIDKFLLENDSWVIEGCYADLLRLVINCSNKVIFLNPGEYTCIDNCKKRTWEPHKYKSLEEQNKNLGMLINWIKPLSFNLCRFRHNIF